MTLCRFYEPSVRIDLYDLEGALTALRELAVREPGLARECRGAMAALEAFDGRSLRDQSEFMQHFELRMREEDDV